MAVIDEWRQWADGRINKHDRDLYEGNGKPSIIVRLDRVEGITNEVKWLARTILVIALGILARSLFKG